MQYFKIILLMAPIIIIFFLKSVDFRIYSVLNYKLVCTRFNYELRCREMNKWMRGIFKILRARFDYISNLIEKYIQSCNIL